MGLEYAFAQSECDIRQHGHANVANVTWCYLTNADSRTAALADVLALAVSRETPAEKSPDPAVKRLCYFHRTRNTSSSRGAKAQFVSNDPQQQ